VIVGLRNGFGIEIGVRKREKIKNEGESERKNEYRDVNLSILMT
jgi:hypothetical protein